MKKPLISLCMIVKADREEAKVLDRALWSCNSNHVDEICITITGDCKEVEEVALKYGARISRFDWIEDFAAARNFNFSQATGDYVVWIDADDVVVGSDNLRRIAKTMRTRNVHGIAPWYLYHFDKFGNCDVKHRKTRIVKNEPGLWTWGKDMCELHEDLTSAREITMSQLDPSDKKTYLEIHHLTDDIRLQASRERNLRISLMQVSKYPEDPRAYWNLGNSYLGMGKNEEAVPPLRKFVELSRSVDEKALALHRLAMALVNIGEVEGAKECEYRAIDMLPWSPDAYIGLGTIHYQAKHYKNAKEFLIAGMSKGVPENAIVFDPQAYTRHPMRLLADCYVQLGKLADAKRVVDKVIEMFPNNPDDTKMAISLEKLLDEEKKVEEFAEKSDTMSKAELAVALASLPDSMQTHPLVCTIRNENFIRKETSGKEVAIFCGYTSEQWDRKSEETGIGGSEEAVLNLSREWVGKGHEVIVYNNCGTRETVDEYGVIWRPYYMFNVRDKFDTLILWRHPKMADYAMNARTLIVDMHDVLPAAEFTADRLKRIDKVMVKSNFHRSLFPNVPDSKIEVVSNGINLSQFSGKPVERQAHRIIYTSSPDRGLEHLLDIWPQVRKAVPDAELHVFYGWGVFDSLHADDTAKMSWKESMLARMNVAGIVQHGRVGHAQIAEEMRRSDVFAYPCHFEEIDCISMKKAVAAGCKIVTTDYAALGEYSQAPRIHKGDWEKYKKILIHELTHGSHSNPKDAEQWSWERVAESWRV